MPVRMFRPGKQARRRLSGEEVYDLRVEALRGVRHALLARRLGVAQSTVTRAIHGDTHARVPFPLEIDYEGHRPRDSPRFHSYEDAAQLLRSTPEDEVELAEHLGSTGSVAS